MLDEGLGIKQDKLEALKYYVDAASQDHDEGNYYCGLAYSLGDAIPQDHKKAIHFYEKAALLGNKDAQFALGIIYEEGAGTTQDYVQAHKWLNISAANENDEAVEARDSVAEKMSSDQVAKAQDLAREWLENQEE